MTVDLTFSWSHIIQFIGYIIASVALYYGIRMDLVKLLSKAEAAQARADDAHKLAVDAHKSIFSHVKEFHTDRRHCNE